MPLYRSVCIYIQSSCSRIKYITKPDSFQKLVEVKLMSITTKDVLKIANLARLQIAEDELDQYAKDLSNIITLVEQMNKIDTQNILPMAHPQDATQRLREDKVTEENQRDKFQSIAPHAERGLYVVPKVIE